MDLSVIELYFIRLLIASSSFLFFVCFALFFLIDHSPFAKKPKDEWNFHTMTHDMEDKEY